MITIAEGEFMIEITYENRNTIIKLVDEIISKVDNDETTRKNMAFTWDKLEDVNRFNIFCVGMIILGLTKEWSSEYIELDDKDNNKDKE